MKISLDILEYLKIWSTIGNLVIYLSFGKVYGILQVIGPLRVVITISKHMSRVKKLIRLSIRSFKLIY